VCRVPRTVGAAHLGGGKRDQWRDPASGATLVLKAQRRTGRTSRARVERHAIAQRGCADPSPNAAEGTRSDPAGKNRRQLGSRYVRFQAQKRRIDRLSSSYRKLTDLLRSL